MALTDTTVPAPSTTDTTTVDEAGAGAPTIVVIDGNALAHRAYRGATGAGGDATSDPRHMLVGFAGLAARAVSAVAERCQVAGVVVGFDGDPANAVRRARWPEYKANRDRDEPSLDRQLTELSQLLADAGIDVVVADGWEADDVCGSVATAAVAEGSRCVIVTSDRDSYQLLEPNVRVLRPRNGGGWEWVGPSTVKARCGVAPSDYVAYAALRGDTSDNLAGVRGIGEKRAATVIDALAASGRTLADLVAGDDVAATAVGAKVAAAVADAADAVTRNLEIMVIRRDVPVDLAAAKRPPTPQMINDACRSWQVPAAASNLARVGCCGSFSKRPPR